MSQLITPSMAQGGLQLTFEPLAPIQETTPAPPAVSERPYHRIIKAPVRSRSASEYEGTVTIMPLAQTIPDLVIRTINYVVEAQSQAQARPLKKKPRRAFSVSEKEAIVHTHQPSANLNLLDLPSEILYSVFDFLDPIDSVCFGLAARRLYPIHRRLNGTVPLNSARQGRNNLEWVWHADHSPASLAAIHTPLSPLTDEQIMKMRGQVYCRKCGTKRCQLHRHLVEWMGPGYEYCAIRRSFGPLMKSMNSDKEFCHRSNPLDKRRCGRHQVPATPRPIST